MSTDSIDRIHHHLVSALDAATNDQTRFHLRQSMQLLDVAEAEAAPTAVDDIRLLE